MQTDVMGVQDAVAGGALAFFGDKVWRPGAVVPDRHLQQGIVRERHCPAHGKIGLFRIVSESESPPGCAGSNV